MANHGYWHDPTDGAERRFTDEHVAVSAVSDDTGDVGEVLTLFGDGAVLPMATIAVCEGCLTSLVLRPVAGGWMHELGLAGRGGCTDARPMSTVCTS